MHFFSKIRYQLAAENKTAKYLRYAIGEIILVVIGILIALQINNWNQNRLENREEMETLKSLKDDFLKSQNNVSETISRQNLVVDFSNKLIVTMREKNRTIDFDTLGAYLYIGAFSYWKIEPVNGTYDALIGSGKLNVIKNKHLKDELAEFSALIKYGFEDEVMSLDLTGKLLEKSSPYSPYLMPPFMVSDFGWKDMNIDTDKKSTIVNKHLNNNSFLGSLIIKFVLELNRLNYQKDILKHIEDILSIIDEELSNKAKNT